MLKFLDRGISFSFYALFFLVPIVFTNDTSELFELNKMWLTWGLAVIIMASWLTKMVMQKQVKIQRTPLDIPILLFLASQLISTLISLDPHTSFWGYYSRFNGGFLSLLTYVLLYYAFVSNIKIVQVMRYVYTILLSGIIVSLWGLPSHFGYDPTCLLFRGTFDVSCWTNAFQPKVRIFSTLGQPDWLSAYLAALIPLAIGMGLVFWEKRKTYLAYSALGITLLFYIDFLYTRSRAGYIGLALSLVAFFVWFFWYKKIHRYGVALLVGLALVTFVAGTAIPQIDKFTLPSIVQKIQIHSTVTKATPPSPAPVKTAVSTGELGGTDSGKIRLFVWQGAIAAWEHYPIFGTGVETFAYAYYLFMPPGHNLTSEFGYLYNKAHNEYLNYLATTGIVGLGTYLVMIAFSLWFMSYALRKMRSTTKDEVRFLIAGLLASYISILVINFFGFSVVIINIFLFLIPAFIFILDQQLDGEKALLFPKLQHLKSNISSPSPFQWILSASIAVVGVYFLYTLLVYWNADKAYGLGQNLVNVGQYQSAYQPLHSAAQARPSEPTFLDQLSLDDAVLAPALAKDKTTTTEAQQLAQEAIAVSDNLTTTHPNVVTYWKTRVRIMYALSQINPQYLSAALIAIQKAQQLAPTDAKISYNLGLILGQTGNIQGAIDTLQNTIQLKRDYRDAYYALGIFYHSAGVDKSGKIINADDAQKAIDEMHFILTNFGADAQATDALKAWNAE